MTFKTRLQHTKGVVDPAPLVDVVFLLLIFFVLSSPYVMQTAYKIELPSSPTPNNVTIQTHVAVIKDADHIFFSDKQTTLDGLGKSLQAAAQRAPNQELIIKADKQVPLGVIVEVMNIALKAGITSVNIATRPEVLISPAEPVPGPAPVK